MKQTLLRQWSMLRKIPHAPKTIDAATLQKRLEEVGHNIGLRTIQRDLNTLSAELPLIADENKPQGWSWSADVRYLDLPLLEPQAALTFHLVERHLQTLLPPSTLDYLSPWFRAAGVFVREEGEEIARWPDKIRILPRGYRLMAPDIDGEAHAAVYRALLEERQLDLSYQSRASTAARDYIVHPLGVVVRDSLVYLICTFDGYTDVRYLVLHRVRSARVRRQKAILLPEFSLDAYIAAGHLGFSDGGDAILVEARFSVAAAAHLYECPAGEHQTIEPDGEGHVKVRFMTPDTKELQWWLLGFGAQVTVMGPPELRARMRESIAGMAQAYAG
ncbi:MAG TPA: WYL domain-containing protein [Herbaspirillum sp.]|uniref:helix-turn-helix transcriptional regulator n=1 Tax=Herbaspirillum sp. TaxID=1890675 RepID=UPI002D2752D1|nr:WYL domain-containing protein [Herbaspirillum sp.]HZG20861.1 WYL domain-containing protein [Herbaspirillum sp.]